MWSGGKDGALALDRARRSGLEIGCLVNFHDPATRRVRFHATRVELIAAQAVAAGLPLRTLAVPWEGFDQALREELRALRGAGYDGVVLGDIHLADVRAWYEERVLAAGLEHVEPLWGGEPAELVAEFVESGGRAVITCCQDSALDETWLGRVIDERFPEEILPAGVDPCGERGEYHSFAFAGPLFTSAVGWRAGDRRNEDGFSQLDLLPEP